MPRKAKLVKKTGKRKKIGKGRLVKKRKKRVNRKKLA